LVAKDIIIKGFIAFQVRNTLNEAIEVIKQYTQALREGGSVTPPNGQGSESKASQSSSAQYYPTEEVPSTPIPTMPVNEDRFNFENNDTYTESMVQKHEIPEDGKAALLARRKLDRQIEAAVNKHTPASNNPSRDNGSAKTGKRGRKPHEYIPKMDEDEIAEALILRETKENDVVKIAGLD
jgi:hypothetical protein